MSVKNFSELQEVGILDTDDSLVLGGYSIDTEIELRHVSVLLYKAGALAGTERVRIRMTSDPQGIRTLHTSDWANLSDSNNINDGDHWLGWIRTDFNRPGIAKDVTRYLVLDVSNYTRNDDTFFLSVVRDYPFPIYSSAATSFESATYAVTIFGYEEE
jgi:hypothetical protein